MTPTPTTTDDGRHDRMQLSNGNANGHKDVNENEVSLFKPEMRLRGHVAAVTSAKFSPNSELIASASDDLCIKIWNAKTGQFIKELYGHTKGISELAWSVDSVTLATASDDGTIRVWNINSGKCLRELSGHTADVTCLDFNYKGNLIASGSTDENVMIWSVIKGQMEHKLQAHTDPVSSVRFSPDGTVIASSAHDGLIRIWDSQSAHCLHTFINPDKSPILDMKFTPNGKYLLACSNDGKTRLWNVLENKCSKTYSTVGNVPAYCSIFVEDRYIAQGVNDTIRLWDLQSKQCIGHVARKHTDQILSISYQDRRMISVSKDQTIVVYRLEQ